MPAARMTSKGQVTVPVEVRKKLGLKTGVRIEFIYNEESGCYEFLPAKRSIKSLAGIIKWTGKPVSIEEMNEAIARQGAAAR